MYTFCVKCNCVVIYVKYKNLTNYFNQSKYYTNTILLTSTRASFNFKSKAETEYLTKILFLIIALDLMINTYKLLIKILYY